MAEVEFAGLKFKGGKIFAIIIALSTLVGGLYGAFEVYQRYLSMEKKINNFVSPDLSAYDRQIAVINSELSMILDEVTLISDVAKDLKNDLKIDLRQLEGDIRHITTIVNDVEDRQKADSREIQDELKSIEKALDIKIQKSLTNPLANMK
tara:strand:- start:390 stop:839 length:450 start_codon:yes stop_codon:yes gene_type:complete